MIYGLIDFYVLAHGINVRIVCLKVLINQNMSASQLNFRCLQPCVKSKLKN